MWLIITVKALVGRDLRQGRNQRAGSGHWLGLGGPQPVLNILINKPTNKQTNKQTRRIAVLPIGVSNAAVWFDWTQSKRSQCNDPTY